MGTTKMSNEKRVEIILKELRRGEPRKYAVAKSGVTYKTFLRWMQGNVIFNTSVKEAEIEGLADIEASARSKIRESDAWQAQAWLLERMIPDKYKLKTEQHTTQPVQIVVDKDDTRL